MPLLLSSTGEIKVQSRIFIVPIRIFDLPISRQRCPIPTSGNYGRCGARRLGERCRVEPQKRDLRQAQCVTVEPHRNGTGAPHIYSLRKCALFMKPTVGYSSPERPPYNIWLSKLLSGQALT
jgi:hypothetical protein